MTIEQELDLINGNEKPKNKSRSRRKTDGNIEKLKSPKIKNETNHNSKVHVCISKKFSGLEFFILLSDAQVLLRRTPRLSLQLPASNEEIKVTKPNSLVKKRTTRLSVKVDQLCVQPLKKRSHTPSSSEINIMLEKSKKKVV